MSDKYEISFILFFRENDLRRVKIKQPRALMDRARLAATEIVKTHGGTVDGLHTVWDFNAQVIKVSGKAAFETEKARESFKWAVKKDDERKDV